MANIHIKSDERKEREAYVLESFGHVRSGAISPAEREAAEVIAERTREAYNEMKQADSRKTRR